MIRLRGRRIARELRDFCAWLAVEMDVRQPVDVHLTSRLYGFFHAPGRSSGFEPYIIASTEGNVLDTIAHEMVHYEQWRDKRPNTERGVEQRARALVRRWRRERAT